MGPEILHIYGKKDENKLDKMVPSIPYFLPQKVRKSIILQFNYLNVN